MAYSFSLEDSSPLLIYEPAGAWKGISHDDPATFASFHTTATQGAPLIFSSNGTGWLYGSRGPNYGAYSVSIDGRPVIEEDVVSAFQQLLGAAAGLEMALQPVTPNIGSFLDLDYMTPETPVPEDTTMSTFIFDDTDPNISYDFQWTASEHVGSYNDTIHSTQNPDASIKFSFDGDGIAIYGTVSPPMGNYTVNLDGVEHQFNGNSDGAARVLEQTLLYFANNIGTKSHSLVITANPSELGDPSLFELDAISVLSTSSSAANSISVPDASSSTFLPLSTTSSWNSRRTLSPASNLTPASERSRVLTDKAVIAGIASAGAICLLGMVFLSLFCWKRHRCDPPSCKDKKPTSPGLPIQDAEKHAGLDSPTHISHRRNDSVTSVWSESCSTYSSTSDGSRRILINGVLAPPQFKTPRKPVPSVPPRRPSRIRDSIQIPF